MELSVVGKNVQRIDVLEKVTGEAVFSTDVWVPRMLHSKVLRSPYPHARINHMDTSQAERLPGVRCVVTGKDAPDKRYGFVVFDQPVITRDVVRWVGEPVAAVAADNIDIAQEALALIKVEYDELPSVFDGEVAMSQNPPVVIHPDLFSYDKARKIPFDLDRPNVFYHHKIRTGDVAKGFQDSYLVMDNKFTTRRVQHCALEPHAAIVTPTPEGGLTICSGRQDVWILRNWIGELFGIKPSLISVVRPYVGGSFGSKYPIIVEPIVALLALKTSRPVKLVFTREEVFLSGGNRVPMDIYIKDGVSKEGYLLAREITAVLRAGAYSNILPAVTRNCSFAAVGTYKIPNFKWDSYGVYVNEPPACNFRGFGSTQVTFAIESHMDMLAEKLGMDAVEFRAKNVIKEGETNINGEITHSTGARECLDKMADYLKSVGKPHDGGPWKKGKGISLANKVSSAPCAALATVKIKEDGMILVYHGADDIGQGCNTVAAQIAAEEFGVSIDQVKVIFTDTCDTNYFYGGSTSSRVTYHLGNAVKMACDATKKKLFEIAAERLQVTRQEELETKGGLIYAKAAREKCVRITELFTGYKKDDPGKYGTYTRGGEIIGSATWIQENTPEDPETGRIDPNAASKGMRLVSFWSHSAKAVELAVNVETGQVKILRIGSAVDMGRPINPKMCEQQAEGGIAMGIGDTLFEEMQLEKGVNRNPDFTDYKVPSVIQMPLIDDIRTVFAPEPHKDGPFGAKGFGEVATVGVQAAIANAIYQAIGVRIKELPITPERVLQALEKKKKYIIPEEKQT